MRIFSQKQRISPEKPLLDHLSISRMIALRGVISFYNDQTPVGGYL